METEQDFFPNQSAIEPISISSTQEDSSTFSKHPLDQCESPDRMPAQQDRSSHSDTEKQAVAEDGESQLLARLSAQWDEGPITEVS